MEGVEQAIAPMMPPASQQGNNSSPASTEKRLGVLAPVHNGGLCGTSQRSAQGRLRGGHPTLAKDEGRASVDTGYTVTRIQLPTCSSP